MKLVKRTTAFLNAFPNVSAGSMSSGLLKLTMISAWLSAINSMTSASALELQPTLKLRGFVAISFVTARRNAQTRWNGPPSPQLYGPWLACHFSRILKG